MPVVISAFYGLEVSMEFHNSDDDSPRVSVSYETAGDKKYTFHAAVDLKGRLLTGSMPKWGMKILKKWLGMHRTELTTMWKTNVLSRIPPLM